MKIRNKSFNLLEYISEIVGWIQIFISPLIIGCIAGYIIYYFTSNTFGLIIGGLIGLLGLVFGITLANRSWKKGGTVKFLSRVISTPDIDEVLKNNSKQQSKNDDE